MTAGETFVTCEHSLYLEHDMDVSRIQISEKYYSRYSCLSPACYARNPIAGIRTEYSDKHCMSIGDKGHLTLSSENICDVGNVLRGVSLFTFVVSTFSVLTFILTHGITFARYVCARRRVARATRMDIVDSSIVS
jgi:hypothetical protein